MMLSAVEEPPALQKPPEKLTQPKPQKTPHPASKYSHRKPRRAQLLDLQDLIYLRTKQKKITNQELLSLIKSWTELESLLQAHNRYQIDKAELPKSVAKSLASVAEDDPAAGIQATDKPTS